VLQLKILCVSYLPDQESSNAGYIQNIRPVLVALFNALHAVMYLMPQAGSSLTERLYLENFGLWSPVSFLCLWLFCVSWLQN
jgi:hypothetical protein